MTIDTFLSGSTGLIGSNILATLASQTSPQSINAFGRRELTAPSTSSSSAQFTSLVDSDTSRWPALLGSKLASSGGSSAIFFSALGTTRAKAGGLENQRKIDHDLPVSLAEGFAARKTSSPDAKSVFVLISSAGANPNAFFAYSKMKGETEEAVKALLKAEGSTQTSGLDHVVILRPGLIVGERRKEDSRPAEYAIRKLAEFMGRFLGNGAKDFWAQDAEVIARAAVNAGLQCVEGTIKERVLVLGQPDIVRLGRTEWRKSE